MAYYEKDPSPLKAPSTWADTYWPTNGIGYPVPVSVEPENDFGRFGRWSEGESQPPMGFPVVMHSLGTLDTLSPGLKLFWQIAAALSMGACAYHGYKRNQSVGWAIGWGIVGGIFPVISVAVALAQGFGERK